MPYQYHELCPFDIKKNHLKKTISLKMNRMNRRTGVNDCHVPGICLIITDSQTEEVFHQEDSRLCWVLVWCHSNRGTDLLIHCYYQQISRAIAIMIMSFLNFTQIQGVSVLTSLYELSTVSPAARNISYFAKINIVLCWDLKNSFNWLLTIKLDTED